LGYLTHYKTPFVSNISTGVVRLEHNRADPPCRISRCCDRNFCSRS